MLQQFLLQYGVVVPVANSLLLEPCAVLTIAREFHVGIKRIKREDVVLLLMHRAVVLLVVGSQLLILVDGALILSCFNHIRE